MNSHSSFLCESPKTLSLIQLPMAISASPDWSLASVNPRRSGHHFSVIISTCKTLTFLPAHRLHHAASSSACHSPILEEASTIKPEALPPTLPEGEKLNESMIRLFQDRRTEDLAFRYYEKARRKPDFRPDKLVLTLLLRYLIRSKPHWYFIALLSGDFSKFNVLPDGHSCATLVNFCVRGRKFRIARTLLKVFESDGDVAVLAFEAAMKGYNRLHMYSCSVAVFGQMKLARIAPSPGCYFQIMESNMKLGNVDKVVELFREFDNCKLSVSTPFSGRIYKVLCESLGKSGRAVDALGYFREMKRKGIPVDPSIYSSLICSFASIKGVKMVEEIFKEAGKQRVLKDPAVFLKVVLMYVEEGLMEKTLDVVVAMRAAKVKISDCILCAIVNGFSKQRGFRAAAEVYEELTSRGTQPGQVTYASVLNVYCRLKLYDKAEEVFSEMVEKGFDKCVVAYSTMVAMYGKTGRLREAMRLVAKMKERGCQPNVWIYNALLDMHGRASDVRQVEKIWKEMARRKVTPDMISYTSIISAYNRVRDFEACMAYYNEYRTNGGAIDKLMAGIMVGVFSKLSRIDELLKLLGDIKSERTPIDERLHRSAMNALRDSGLQMYSTKWLPDGFEVS